MTIKRPIGVCYILLVLAGCSGGSGPAVVINPDLSPVDASSRSLVLNGPPPQTDDIQRFRVELWENIAPADRCGECHGTGGQSPTFARSDDINLAYGEIGSVVNLITPSRSRLVTKVAAGHNCWQASDQTCADILTTWIGNWAGDSGANSNTIELTAPVARQPGAARSFPADPGTFATTVHPLLTRYCSDCHADTSAIPQSPFFAVTDVEAAYSAARSKIELDDPVASRLVVRLADEFHNCWSNCSADALEMLSAIESFVAGVPVTEIPAEMVTSRALRLIDGVVASGGGRMDSNVVAMYQFKTLAGNTAFDTSGVEPAMNLNFTGDVSWVGGWGVRVGDDGRAQASTGSSRKLQQLITATGEYSIEAWVAPANVTQEEARIVSYAGGNTTRNFSLGQNLYNYDFLARSSGSDANGDPALSTPDADEVLQATLQHVVATFDPTNGRQLFVNGERIDVADEAGGNLNDWDDTFAFSVGNEVSGDRLWRGVLRLVAIHNRALAPSHILQNFEAGVGEQFLLLFGVDHLTGLTDTFIVFEVSQFDNYSYLFSQPFFVSLDGSLLPDGIPLKGLRIGINGREPEVGQAYARLEVSLSADAYSPERGQPLSPIGTIFGIEKGADSDEFFLTFEQFGDATDVRLEPELERLPPLPDREPVADIGVRLFDEINATMAGITGVSSARPDVYETFVTVRQQLPASEQVEGFLSSQQMGITQLAIEYCSALMEDPVLRASHFPGFDFTGPVAASLDAIGRDVFFDSLLNLTIGTDLPGQPDHDLVRAELEALTDRLTVAGAGSERTLTITKASCAATLGSAAMLIQ